MVQQKRGPALQVCFLSLRKVHLVLEMHTFALVLSLSISFRAIMKCSMPEGVSLIQPPAEKELIQLSSKIRSTSVPLQARNLS